LSPELHHSGRPNDAASRAAAAIEAGLEGAVAALARMIAVDTSFPPGAGYPAFADLMEELAGALGFACERITVPEALWAATGSRGPRINLIARRRTGRPICGIYFHVDTAPAGDGWTQDPLRLTRDGERLVGRGTCDMKGAIAATLLAIKAADAAGLAYAFDPELLLCTDEEGGLYPGIRYLAEQRLIARPDAGHVLCLNGSAAPRIWAGCFGSMDLAIRVEGRSAHSGDPGSGINAVEEALPILTALTALKARVEQRRSAMPPPPHHDGRPLAARLTITAINGGVKGSALPGLCTIVVNRRYPPEESFDAVRAELEQTIRDAAARTRALEVTTELVGHLAPVSDPDRGAVWPRWQAALGVGFGYAPTDFRRWGSGTSSDMGFVQQAGHQEILLGGLARPDTRQHGPDEFTTIGDLKALATALLVYLTDPVSTESPPRARAGARASAREEGVQS
jgi:succinyl-diaminopimelate desuccinylase